jgi:hypothetical protein
MIHNRKARIAAYRAASIATARSILEEIADGTLDPYEGYRRVYGLYVNSSGLLDELKPLFRLPGIEPDGSLHVDDEFRNTVRTEALHWLSENSN